MTAPGGRFPGGGLRSNSSAAVFRELRAITGGPNAEGPLQVMVFIEGRGPAALGVQGWHWKTFTGASLLDVLTAWQEGREDPLTWPVSPDMAGIFS